MGIIKNAIRELRYPTKRFDDGEIPQGAFYVILNMDTDMYFNGWAGADRPSFCGTPEFSLTYTHGMGKQLSDDLYRLRKLFYRVTTTNKDMNWK